jgi:hypothetical protein
MKYYLLLIIPLLAFGSCTTPVFISKELPPELVLPKQPARIVYSIMFNYRENPGIKDKHEAAYQTGIDEFGISLVSDVVVDNPVILVTLDTAIRSSGKGLHPDFLMEKSDIVSLCNSYAADYLLILDSLRLNFDWEVIREESDDGSVSKTKDFYIVNNYFVSLYDNTGEVIERTLLEKGMFYRSRPTLGGLFTIMPNLDNAKDKIGTLAHEAGTEYHRMFYPSAVTEPRILYGGKHFKDTNSLILSGEYDKAIVVLQDIMGSLKPKHAQKAHNNLEVAKEMKQIYQNHTQKKRNGISAKSINGPFLSRCEPFRFNPAFLILKEFKCL